MIPNVVVRLGTQEGQLCKHCGVRFHHNSDEPICDDCYDAMAHFQPPTNRALTISVVQDDGNVTYKNVGTYNIVTGKVTLFDEYQ